MIINPDTHRHGRIGFLLTVLILLICVKANAAGVDYSVGSTQYCAQSVAQTPSDMVFHAWTLGTCQVTPPPFDPLAITRSNVTYRTQGGNSTASNVDVTQFANVFGRAAPAQPIQQYPYVTGSTASIAVSANRYLPMQIHMPANPGIAGHTFKSNSYGSTGNKQFKAKVVPLGGNWSTATWLGCEQSGHRFSENATIFNIRVGPPPASPNRAFCYLNPGASYVVLTAWVSPTDFGTMTFTWY